MNIFPFDALGTQTRTVLWNVIVHNDDWIPHCGFMLPSSFSHDRQTAAYAWAKENGMKVFISVTLKLVLFQNDDDATIFKLTWLTA